MRGRARGPSVDSRFCVTRTAPVTQSLVQKTYESVKNVKNVKKPNSRSLLLVVAVVVGGSGGALFGLVSRP